MTYKTERKTDKRTDNLKAKEINEQSGKTGRKKYPRKQRGENYYQRGNKIKEK